MSESWLPTPEPNTDGRGTPFWCPSGDSILQDVRPSEDGWRGWCPSHGDQLGVQFDHHSQEPENHPEEELDEYDRDA